MTQLAWELRYHDVVRSKTLTKDALDLADDSALEAHKGDIIVAHCNRNLAFIALVHD
jgi:hypothetical protein